MKNVSSKYLSKMQDGIRTFIPRMTIAGVDVDGDIQAGMTINFGSCGAEQFVIGNIYIPYITATIAGCTQKLQDKEILLEMGLVLGDGTVEYKNMGYYTVEKPTADKFQTSFTAYGRLMSKAGGTYTSDLTYPASITSVLDEIKSQTGLNIVLNGLTASGNIETPIVGELHRGALMYIAGLLGGFVTENGDGDVVISKYMINKAASVDLDFCYTYPETNDEKYTVTGISVEVSKDGTDEDGNAVEGEIYASGNNVNVSVYNPYMTESLFDACKSNIVGFSYMPAKVEFLGDISLDPWDSIVLTDIDPDTGIDALNIDIPCMEIVHTWDGGLVTTITAPGSTETEDVSAFGGPMSTKVEKIYQQMLSTPSNGDIARVKSLIEKQMQTLTGNIIGKNGGHFSITYNDDGLPTGWTIMDTPVLTDATKMWIMSQGGLGFSIDGGKNISKLAFDMDGNFYADCIMGKSITAEKIDIDTIFTHNITATGSITGLKFISLGTDDYNYAAKMVLDAGELHLTAGDEPLENGAYAYSFHTDIAAHDIELSYNAPEELNRLYMNGNLIEHIFKNKKSGESMTVFKSSLDGVEVSSIDISEGITGTAVRPLYNGAPLALYSDLASSSPGEQVEAPVLSVNGKTGVVVLSATDVGARPKTWMPSASEVGADPSGTAAGMLSVFEGELNTHMSKVDQLLQEYESKFEEAGGVEWNDIIDKPFGEVVQDEGNRRIYKGGPTWSNTSIPSAVITPTEPLYWDAKYTLIVDEDVVYNCSIGSEDILNNLTYTTQDEKIRFSAHGEYGEQILVEMLDGSKPTTLEFCILSRTIVDKQLDPKFVPSNSKIEWDYVVNKPFGATKQKVIEWNGAIDDREMFAFGLDTAMYHVSDLVCEYEDAINGGGIHVSGSRAPDPADLTFSSEDVYKLSDDVFFVKKDGFTVLVCLKDNYETTYEQIYALLGTPDDAKAGTAIIPKKGIYMVAGIFFAYILFYVDKFYLNEGEFAKYEPLGPEYLPEVPHFDLAAKGLPAVLPNNSTVSITTVDTTDIMKAMDKGQVAFDILVSMGETPSYITICGSIGKLDDTYQIGMVGYYGGTYFTINIIVSDNYIGAVMDILTTFNMPN